MIISPDEGAMNRAVYLANNLGVDMGMFYKRRDYSRVIDGRNPIVAHEFLGTSVEGKTVLIIDDMIASGESMLDTARELKERKAERLSSAAPSACSPPVWKNLTSTIRMAHRLCHYHQQTTVRKSC